MNFLNITFSFFLFSGFPCRAEYQMPCFPVSRCHTEHRIPCFPIPFVARNIACLVFHNPISELLAQTTVPDISGILLKLLGSLGAQVLHSLTD